MPAALTPDGERNRLQSLVALDILDSPPEPEFDAMVRTAALVCDAPIALVSLIDADRLWFKASVGIAGVSEMPREWAYCDHAIQAEGLFEVADATRDPRFAESMLVRTEPHVRFYAGTPLRLAGGSQVGTLCVMDHQPRQLNAMQREVLCQLGIAASRAMEARREALDRVSTAQALTASEARLRKLYESTPAMLHSIDPTGRIMTVSNHWLATLGYHREDVIGRPAFDFMTEASREHARRVAFPVLLANGVNNEVPFEMVAKSGAVVDVRLSSVLERDAAGKPLYGVSVIRDVTDQLGAERALQEERQRLASIIEGTGAGAWEMHLQTGQTRFNAKWAAMLGQTLEELADWTFETWDERAHPDDREKAKEAMAAHLAGERADYESEVRMRHRDGHWVWVLTRGRVLTWTNDGQPEWIFGIKMDLSARKQQEEALRKSESFLNRTGEIAGVGGWEYDVASRKLFWSTQVCRIHGVDPDHRPEFEEAMRFFAPEGRPAILAAVQAALHEGQGFDLELPLIRADGRRIWVRVACSVEGDAGAPTRFVGAFQDITVQVEQRRAIERANERVALATDSGRIGIWEFDLDSSTMTMDAWGWHAYGLPGTAQPLTLAQWLEHVHPDDRSATLQAAQQAVAGSDTMDIEFRVVWPDGSVHHLRSTARQTRDGNTGGDSRALRLVGAIWDVTPLRRLSAQLAEQHELMRVTLKSIGDAVVTTDAAGEVTWLNPVAERLTGWQADAAKGRPLAEVFRTVDAETRLPSENPVAACVQQGRGVVSEEHALMISRDGQEFGIEASAAPIRDADGAALGVVLVFRDVTEQRRLADEMSHRARHDALTGLVNRAEFETRLRRTLQRSHDDGSEHAMMYIDLDQFKLVNDACGHSVGDQLLQQVGKLLAESVRTRDTLGRLGGDEFAVILEHCSTEQAQRVAQKICDRMDDFRFVSDGRRFRIGTSIGLVPLDARWDTPMAALQAADTSCYAAKEEGRNRVHTWFDTDLAIRARDGETKWATRLEQALDEGRFVLFAQRIEPVRDECRSAASGLHAEVLLRLVDGDGSLVAPGAFLPAAERFHLASRIDRWVLGHAIGWLGSLADLGGIRTLCVNLSGQSIGDRAFHRHALTILNEAGDAVCKRLCLEITETAAVTNLADAALFIEQVRLLGVRIALDDFGAGASSFGYLKTLRVDMLKIDGQFIRDLLDDPLDDVAVRCFVDVARVMGLKTVAEFVDRPELLVRLREIGVDYAQGFLLHRPEPIDRLCTEARSALAVAAS
jgi:diguanylate cyclase (GGDEF)-like protein/PAS domain S-box-containing protein